MSIATGVTSDVVSFVVVDLDFPDDPSEPANITFNIMELDDLPLMTMPSVASNVAEDTEASVLSFVSTVTDADTPNLSLVIAISSLFAHGTLRDFYSDGTEEVRLGKERSEVLTTLPLVMNTTPELPL